VLVGYFDLLLWYDYWVCVYNVLEVDSMVGWVGFSVFRY
jgi:hypothetical protein